MEVNLGVTEKPSNLHKYNMSVHINIYKENEAYVNHLQERVREEKEINRCYLLGRMEKHFLIKKQLEVS